MKIKKVALALFATGLVLSSSVVSAAGAELSQRTQGAGGVINFHGEVTVDSCDVTTGSKNPSVELGTWAVNYFNEHTETSPTQFKINVENCPESVKEVAVLFDGAKDSHNSTLLQLNPGEESATGLGVKIYNDDQTTAIEPGQVSDTLEPNKDGTAELTFYASLAKTGSDDVTAGHVNAVSNFLMVYN